MMGGLRSGPGPDHRPNRALPEWAIDKLVFGLREDQGGSDPRKVWGECVSIGMSAYRRGWTRNEFVDEVTKYEKKKGARGRKRWTEHRLWVQLRSYNSSPKAAFKALDKAWEAAVANLNGVGMRTKEEIRDDAVERAFLWADRLTDDVDGLTETEAAVIGYVMSETERRGMMRVTCPSRSVAYPFPYPPHPPPHQLLLPTPNHIPSHLRTGRPDTCQHRRTCLHRPRPPRANPRDPATDT